MAGPKAVTQYEAVRERIGQGMKVGEAVAAVADDLGISAKTLHTNYYRVAREQGTTATRRSRTTRATLDDTPSEELVRTALDALTQLAKRAETLEEDSRQLAQIRRQLTD